MEYIKYNGRYRDLKAQGFRFQKLYANNVIYYIRDVPGSTIDNSLFIRKAGNLVRSFINLDFGSIRMAKYFGEKDGYSDYNEFVRAIDVDILRKSVKPEIKLVEAIDAGFFEEDLSEILDTTYNNQEVVHLGYDVLTHTIVKLPVWRGDLLDPNRPLTRLNIVEFYVHKIHFDWLRDATWTGAITVAQD